MSLATRIIPRRGTLPPTLPQRPGLSPVVLLHGTLSSPGNFSALSAKLTEKGRPVLAPEYGERGTAPLATCVKEIADLLTRAALRAYPAPLDVIGHSLGGLVAALAIEEHMSEEATHHIRSLIGLGACWHGLSSSWWSRHALSRSCVDYLLGPCFADLLHRYDPTIPDYILVHSVVSTIDTVVPAWSSHLGIISEVRAPHSRIPDCVDTIVRVLDSVDASKNTPTQGYDQEKPQ